MFKNFLLEIGKLDPFTQKNQIQKKYVYYISKTKEKINKPKKEEEIELIRKEVIEVIKTILCKKENMPTVSETIEVFNLFLRLGTCLEMNQFPRRLEKAIRGVMDTKLSPENLPNFLKNELEISVEKAQKIQEQVYIKFASQLEKIMTNFSCRLLLFLLKLIPSKNLSKEKLSSFVKTRMTQ